MLYEIFKFELKYRSKRADTYIYFLFLFLYSIIAVDIIYEGALDGVKRNAPTIIARTMGIISALFMLITSMIMGVAALRDFDHGMESLMFVNPLKKRDYLMGRFFGSFVILLLIFCGVPLGMMLGDFMPWNDPENLLAFNASSYFQPFISLVIPTLFFSGAIFFVGGALSRKMLVVYTQGILFLMIYLLSNQLLQGAANTFYVSLFDPFTFQSVAVSTQYWTVLEKNTLLVPFDSLLLFNRLIWLGIGVIALLLGYKLFQFKVLRKGRNKVSEKNTVVLDTSSISNVMIPKVKQVFNGSSELKQLFSSSLFCFKSVLKEAPFWAMVICAMSIIFLSSINLGTAFGVNSHPTTYIIVGELFENSAIFFLLIIIFYAGELVWMERNRKLQHIQDALPISDFSMLVSKFLGLNMVFVSLMIAMIVAGIVFQLVSGYYKIELDVYLSGFFLEIAPFLLLISGISFFFQVIVNHKYLAHFVTIIFVFGTTLPLKFKGLDHGLFTLGGTELAGYSDMNGYGHFLEPFLWFKTYWLAIVLLLLLFAVVIQVRGTETNLFKRLRSSRKRLTQPLKHAVLGSLLIIMTVGGYIFYNTNVINDYAFLSTENKYRASYEKTLKPFRYLPQPKIVDVNLKVELYPSERAYTAEGYYTLVNRETQALSEIHIQKMPSGDVVFEYLDFTGGATLDSSFVDFEYFIYQLNEPLRPGDSLKMKFKQVYTTEGFTERSDNNVVDNGTFITNFQFPTIGYMDDVEVASTSERKDLGLDPQEGRPKMNDPHGLTTGRNDGDGEEIRFEMILGTEDDQIAVTSGKLLKQWSENNRNYFHYKSYGLMSHFYAMLSARYEVVSDQWIPTAKSNSKAVDLEIYYHNGHEYNLKRMLNGMKKSLSYFTENFSPYQYDVLRIVEVPNYRKRAQSFPNTVPFSESVGFILDIEEEDVDMAFYVTAHEVAHQWWGHQVNPANVEGKSMIAETLAQYSAIMVLKEKYSQEKVQQFIETQHDSYLNGRASEVDTEKPLSRVDDEEYLYYRKGAINMYTLQDYISEDSVNVALKRFIKDWNSFNDLPKERYSITTDLLKYFRDVTPDSLLYVITDLFESVIHYDNKILNTDVEKLDDGTHLVNIEVNIEKYNNGVLVKNLSDFIEIGIFDEAGNELYLKKHKVVSEGNRISIIVNSKPARVGVDPYRRLIDTDFDNNIKEL